MAVARNGRRIVLLLYVTALLASTFVRHRQLPPTLPDGMQSVSLPAIRHDHVTTSVKTRLAFVDTAPNASSMPIILVHGSPGSSKVFERLTDMLSGQFRVIVPDLPGFGASTHAIADYSFRAHAWYLLELMDALHIPKAQVVGFSMGGGVVLSLADIAPKRVASIVMLSAIGVQEQELLGNYNANHMLHGLQLGALWLLRAGAPHFGVLDRLDLNVEYARNFYDSDQRPLRSALAHYQGPMLILHGTHDPLVPIAAAMEHHKIVPQSELILFDDNHFMVFQRPERIVSPLRTFLEKVDRLPQS